LAIAVTMVYCRSQQRGTDYISRGNHLVDQVAKRAVEERSSPGVLEQTAKLLLSPELPPTLNYTKEGEQWAK
jgi:hypothetical protein